MGKRIAIVGAGNGGQAFAGYLSMKGHTIRIFDVVQATVDTLNEKGGVLIEGNSDITGFGKIELASTDMATVLEGAEIILVVLPSIYHKSMAQKMAPVLKDGQCVILNPHASMGPVEFRKTLNDCGCTANILLACTATLLFACRAVEIGHVVISGQKTGFVAAAYPSSDNEKVAALMADVIPQFDFCEDVIRVSLDNINAFAHPAPTILNTGRIESHTPFEYYLDMTESQARYVEALDKERMALAKAYVVNCIPLMQEYLRLYECTHGDTFHEVINNCNPSLAGIKGATTLRTRYLYEDVPYSLEALSSLGKIAGVPTPCMDAIITVGRTLVPDMDEGRTLRNLGLEGVSKDEFLHMCRG